MPVLKTSTRNILFRIDGKTFHALHCAKSRVFAKAIDSIIESYSFDKQCLILKVLLQSEQTKQHMVIIGVDQSLSNSALY